MATILEAMPGEILAYDEYVDRDHYEIVDGVKVEMPPMSADSQGFTSRLARLVGNYGIEQNLGECYVEMLFKLPLPADRNRKPDVAFVPYTRWAKHRALPSTNEWDVLPDLLVEVVSPFDLVDTMETKVEEYLQSGTRLVWVVYPRHGRIYVYDSAGKILRLSHGDTLDGGPVLPGFQLPLAELFPVAAE